MTLNQVTYTAAEVANYVKRQFGDESGVQITDTDIFRWLNSAQLEIISQIAPIHAKGTTDIVSGQKTYDLTGLNIFRIESLHYDGRRVEPISFQEAERKIIKKDYSVQISGIPAFWYEFAGQVSFWPVPSSSITNGLEIYYVKMPSKITQGSDLLAVPDKFFEAVVAWILAKAYELDEEFDQAANQRTYFQNRIMEQNGEEGTSAFSTYPTITFVED